MWTPQLGSEIRRDVATCGAGIVGRPDRLPPQQYGSRLQYVCLQILNHVDIWLIAGLMPCMSGGNLYCVVQWDTDSCDSRSLPFYQAGSWDANQKTVEGSSSSSSSRIDGRKSAWSWYDAREQPQVRSCDRCREIPIQPWTRKQAKEMGTLTAEEEEEEEEEAAARRRSTSFRIVLRWKRIYFLWAVKGSKGIGNLSSISDSQPGPGTRKLCWDHRSSTNCTETEWVSTFPIPTLIWGFGSREEEEAATRECGSCRLVRQSSVYVGLLREDAKDETL